MRVRPAEPRSVILLCPTFVLLLLFPGMLLVSVIQWHRTRNLVPGVRICSSVVG